MGDYGENFHTFHTIAHEIQHGDWYCCIPGTTLLTVLATDGDGLDNDITYNITYNTPSDGSGSGSGEQATEEPDIFTFSINSDGEISNDDTFPTITDEAVSSSPYKKFWGWRFFEGRVKFLRVHTFLGCG